MFEDCIFQVDFWDQRLWRLIKALRPSECHALQLTKVTRCQNVLHLGQTQSGLANGANRSHGPCACPAARLRSALWESRPQNSHH